MNDTTLYTQVFDLAEAIGETRRIIYVWIDDDDYRPQQARIKDLRMWNLRREHLRPHGADMYVANSPDGRTVTLPSEVIDDAEALAFFEPVLRESGAGFADRFLAHYAQNAGLVRSPYRDKISSFLNGETTHEATHA